MVARRLSIIVVTALVIINCEDASGNENEDNLLKREKQHSVLLKAAPNAAAPQTPSSPSLQTPVPLVPKICSPLLPSNYRSLLVNKQLPLCFGEDRSCVSIFDECQGYTMNGVCDSDLCTCCIKDDCTRYSSDLCHKYEGTCKRRCGYSEAEVPDGCRYSECKCCYSCDTGNTICDREGGKCVATEDHCPAGEVVKGLCDKPECLCCFGKYVCNQNETCDEKYGGTCKSACSLGEGELPSRCSSPDCRCCYPCNFRSDQCREYGGFCSSSTEPCPFGTIDAAACGPGCSCCSPLNCTNSTNKECLSLNGLCRPSCSTNEVALEGICDYSDCKCCYPCNTNENCGRRGGKCVSDPKSCFPFAAVKGICDGTGCYCCLNNCTNSTNKECLSYNGLCKPSCSANEVALESVCDYRYCNCCYSCNTNENCGRRGGKCVSDPKSCFPLTAVQGICDGAGCYCCLNNCTGSETTECEKYRGECKEKCNDDEGTLDGGCLSRSCECCYPCNTGGKCREAGGYCVPSPDRCVTGILDDNLCDSPGCLCCLPDCRDSTNEKCLSYNGLCKRFCSTNEVALEGVCDYRHCNCCYSCNTNENCGRRGGKCVSDPKSCFPLTAVKGICDGAGCYCCLNNCTITRTCKESLGSCKTTCALKEEELPNGCTPVHPQANCKCCYSCPTSSNCKQRRGTCVTNRKYCTKVGYTTYTGLCAGRSCLCCAPIARREVKDNVS